jgi:hypothetical protein
VEDEEVGLSRALGITSIFSSHVDPAASSLARA